MPFIIAALALVGLLIYGAVRLYAGVAAAYGALAGSWRKCERAAGRVAQRKLGPGRR